MSLVIRKKSPQNHRYLNIPIFIEGKLVRSRLCCCEVYYSASLLRPPSGLTTSGRNL